jgi:hypothetical protein
MKTAALLLVLLLFIGLLTRNYNKWTPVLISISIIGVIALLYILPSA